MIILEELIDTLGRVGAEFATLDQMQEEFRARGGGRAAA